MNKFCKFMAVLAVPAILMLYSYSGGITGGKTGSLGDNNNTCTDCHAGTGGDQIYTGSLSVTEYVPNPIIASVDPDHGEQGWTDELIIIGENTNWSSGVFAVVFKYSEDPSVKSQA